MNAFLFFGSWFLMFLVGGRLIVWLRNKRWKKDVQSQAEAWQVRPDTPETHQKKQGTPSMGGIGIISVAVAIYMASLFTLLVLVFMRRGLPSGSELIELTHLFLLPLCAAGHMGLGFADDWSKASGRGGLRARAKLLGQIALGSLFIIGFVAALNMKPPSPSSGLSGWKDSLLMFSGSGGDLLLMCGFLLLVMVGIGNAVNLTDGIDGLAAGLAVQVGFALTLIEIPQGNELTIFAQWFWAALAGSCLGFLAYNRYPAKVFMGDTGSLAIGAVVGAAAIMCHAVFLLPFIAFIYFVEAGSVTLQVLYFKYTRKKYGEGRRIFRRAPLHHHFELGGWSEWRVVGTFWIINFVMSAIGLILWHLGILPRFP